MRVKNEGNVELTPSYEASLYHSQKGFIKTENFESTTIKPTIGRIDTLALDYSTAGLGDTWEQFLCLPAGDYDAEVKAFDQFDNEFYSGSVSVFILEKGTISTSGDLKTLEHKELVRIGEPVKITGAFENTGDSTEKASLKIEVYKGDRLVEIVDGEETLTDPRKTTDIVAYFTPKELGEFNLLGSVNFGGKFSNTVESDLTVELGLMIVILIVAVPLVILLIIVLILLKKRRG
jgi:hypothetical protein